MTFTIGQKLIMDGKEYEILRKEKRSWILGLNGKEYKASPKKLESILNPKPQQMERRLSILKMFNKEAKLPETKEECMSWAENIACELSPENLSCDGERSRSDVRNRHSALMQEVRELESILGESIDIESMY